MTSWRRARRKEGEFTKIRDPIPNSYLPIRITVPIDKFTHIEVIQHPDAAYYAIPDIHYVIMDEWGKEYPIEIQKFNEEYEILE